MPNLLGIECSSDVLELNQHLATNKTTTQPRRKAVTLWKSEREFQAAVFKAAAWEALRQPAFKLLFAIPNENSKTIPGVRGGVPDLFLAVPSGKYQESSQNHQYPSQNYQYHGCFIELKISGGKLSEKQRICIDELRSNGYFVEVVYDDLDKVMQLLTWYLSLGE